MDKELYELITVAHAKVLEKIEDTYNLLHTNLSQLSAYTHYEREIWSGPICRKENMIDTYVISKRDNCLNDVKWLLNEIETKLQAKQQ